MHGSSHPYRAPTAGFDTPAQSPSTPRSAPVGLRDGASGVLQAG
jgi:hypothetical protein